MQSAIRYTHPSTGLDAVELILRTEETFLIDLPDIECAQIVRSVISTEQSSKS